jgi:hypothetical protein
MRQLQSNNRRRGTVAVIVAVCLTVVLGIAAISVDGGVLLSEKRHAQATADAAALAAASVLYEQYPTYEGKDKDGDAEKAALAEAKANGYANDGTNSVVTVHIPPKTGPYKGMYSYAEVEVTFYQQRSFSRIFGTGAIPVKARAVARGAWIAPNIGVIVLDYTGKGALSSQGNGAFTETGAPVIVNSNNTSALVDTGNGTLIAPQFDITGGYSSSGNGQLITQPTPNNVFTGVHPTPDPLAYLPVPTKPSTGTIDKTSLGMGNFQYVLSPGTHYDLPNFAVGDVVIFKQASAGNGGIFYLESGGLTSTGATIKMDSTTSGGIMIYNAGTGTSDKVNITGNSAGTVDLSPLTSGPYKGLTYFQSRQGAQELHVEGNGSFTIKGTLYAAAAELQVAGNGALSNVGSQYVTRELAISGNGSVSISWSGEEVARTRIITLVE